MPFYTKIFVMKYSNCIITGENLDESDGINVVGIMQETDGQAEAQMQVSQRFLSQNCQEGLCSMSKALLT